MQLARLAAHKVQAFLTGRVGKKTGAVDAHQRAVHLDPLTIALSDPRDPQELGAGDGEVAAWMNARGMSEPRHQATR